MQPVSTWWLSFRAELCSRPGLLKLQWNSNSRNSNRLLPFRGEDVFLGYELGVMPSLAGLQAGEDRLPGAFFSGLKKGLCYFSAFLATVLKGKNSQVQPEIINSFSVLWCGGLFSKSNKESMKILLLKVWPIFGCNNWRKSFWIPCYQLLIVSNLFQSFSLASSVSTSNFLCHHQR